MLGPTDPEIVKLENDMESVYIYLKQNMHCIFRWVGRLFRKCQNKKQRASTLVISLAYGKETLLKMTLKENREYIRGENKQTAKVGG